MRSVETAEGTDAKKTTAALFLRPLPREFSIGFFLAFDMIGVSGVLYMYDRRKFLQSFPLPRNFSDGFSFKFSSFFVLLPLLL